MTFGEVKSSIIDSTKDEVRGHQRGTLRIENFAFECKDVLPVVNVRFETWGTLNEQADNAIVICHALTGDAHAASGMGVDGWWSGIIGPGKAIDTNRWFVICSNVLGGCSGSSGPSDIAADGKPYGLRFPQVTVRDMVHAQIELAKTLGVRSIALVAGGSLGGMQAWEWPLLAPGFVRHTLVIAAQPAFPPLGIGYNEAMRMAIMADANWCGGAYAEQGCRPEAGLAAARAIGMLTYRTDVLFAERFGRTECRTNVLALAAGDDVHREESGDSLFGATVFEPVYQVETYLRHHGDKINGRFDANSYLYLTKAMDSHDIGRGRGGIAAALRAYQGNLTIVGIDTDYLYAARDLQEAAALAVANDVACHYQELTSKFGHDAFLVEFGQLGSIVSEILP